MKRTVLFVICALEQDGTGHAPFFHNMAVYLLRSYLSRCSDVCDGWDFQIVEFMPPASTGTSPMDRSCEALFHAVQQHRPTVVAFSLYLWNVAACHQLAMMIRQLMPEVTVVAGGPEVAEREQFVESFPGFDVVVEGDGELPLRRILVAMQSGRSLDGIPNVSYRRPDGSFAHNAAKPEFENLDALPNFYADVPERLRGQAFILTTRGCCNHCTYCLWARQGLRQRSDEKMLQELETIAASPCEHIVFCDYDLLELYVQRPEVLDAMSAILAKNPKMTVEFFVNAGLVSHPALRDLIRRMNVVRVNVGLQSGHPETLRLVGRPWTIASIGTLFQVPDDLKPYLVVELIYPLPGETLGTYIGTIERLIGAGYFRLQILPLMVLRGSALRRSAHALGLRYMQQPPYYCYETRTVSRDDRMAMAAVAFVLSSLAEPPVHPSLQKKLQAWVCSHPDLPKTIAHRAGQGVDLDALLGEVVEQIFGPAGRAAYAGTHKMYDLYQALREADDQAPPLPARSESPALLLSTAALRDALARVGIDLLAVTLEGPRQLLRCSVAGQPVDLFLLPAHVDGPCYATTERFKVGYKGSLSDPRIMTRFVQCVAALEHAQAARSAGA
jgi:hypothetical protein